MKKTLKSEKGLAVVEATIVFPIVFLVIFFLLYVGNAYMQKCRIDYFVTQAAVEGAALCANPFLDKVSDNKLPGINDKIQPYRYLFGGMSDIESETAKEVRGKMKKMGSGLFSGMTPNSVNVTVDYKNMFLYSTFSVNVEYKIYVPVRMLGERDFFSLDMSSRAEMPVSDAPEFIRNVNTIEDYLQSSGASEKIQEITKKFDELMDKVNQWFK